ncbi:MAG: ABC transporter permease [Cyanobacteria bacterium P01_E01_bin.6]
MNKTVTHFFQWLSLPIRWQTLFSIGMFGFMYLPMLVLAIYSFNESRYGAVWTGFSLKWYAQMLHDSRLLLSLRSSLAIACGAVGLAAILGTTMAVGLARYRFWGKRLYQGTSYLPLIIPDITIAVSTLIFLATLAIPLSIWTTIAAHTVFCLSYIAIVVSTRLSSLDPQLEEAALDLGATPRQAFLKVLLPELTPAIIAGCLLAFVLSLDDLLISSFTFGGGANPLPIEIFSRIRIGVKPDINALSVVLITGSGAIAVMAEYIRYRSAKHVR